jgi:hypothetical protein
MPSSDFHTHISMCVGGQHQYKCPRKQRLESAPAFTRHTECSSCSAVDRSTACRPCSTTFQSAPKAFKVQRQPGRRLVCLKTEMTTEIMSRNGGWALWKQGKVGVPIFCWLRTAQQHFYQARHCQLSRRRDAMVLSTMDRRFVCGKFLNLVRKQACTRELSVSNK